MELLYGKEKKQFTLPRGANFEVLHLNEVKPLKKPLQAMKDALHNPIGAKPFKDIFHTGERICLLVNDSTRVARSELFLPVLIDQIITAGIKTSDIEIMFTNGTHRPLTKEEMIALVGEGVADKIAMYNHDSKNDKMVSIGTTSRGTPVLINEKVYKADRRILTGSIVHHFFAGFGGGRKALIPGVAGFDTIKHNHSLMLDEKACIGMLSGNPVHEDLIEAASMISADFLFNVVLNEHKEIVGVFAGDMIEAHIKGCEMVEKVYGAAIDKLSDVVIASCGGHPKDINMYQAQKTLENAVRAVKQGGQVILLAQCIEGTGSDIYEEWALRYRTAGELQQELSKNFQLGGHKAYAVARALSKGEVYLVSDMDPQKVKQLGFNHAASLEEAISIVYNDIHKQKFTYIIPQGSITVPTYQK